MSLLRGDRFRPRRLVQELLRTLSESLDTGWTAEVVLCALVCVGVESVFRRDGHSANWVHNFRRRHDLMMMFFHDSPCPRTGDPFRARVCVFTHRRTKSDSVHVPEPQPTDRAAVSRLELLESAQAVDRRSSRQPT